MRPSVFFLRAATLVGTLVLTLLSGAPALASVQKTSALVTPRDSGQLKVHIQQLNQSGLNHLTIYLSVVDAVGNPLPDLTKDKVSVTVDGHPAPIQDLTVLANVSEPITAAVLLDTSFTMGEDDKLPNAKAAIKAFGGSLDAQDQVALYQIAGDGPSGVKQLLDFTHDPDHTKLSAVIDPLQAGGKAPIFDALYQVAQDMTKISGRKLVVLQTDQIDDSSIHTLTQALDLLEQVHLPVYTIGLGTGAGLSILQKIAHDTGGTFFSNPDSTGLASSYQAILSQLRDDSFRLIVQTPGVLTVGKHQVQVQVAYQSQVYTDPSPTDPNPPTFVVPATALSLKFSPSSGSQVVGTASLSLDVLGDDLPIKEIQVEIDGKPYATFHGGGPHYRLPVWNVRFTLPGAHKVHITATDIEGNTKSLDFTLRVGVEWSYWIGLLIEVLLVVLALIVLRFARYRFLGGQLEGMLIVRNAADQKAEIELGHEVKGSHLRLRITPKGVVVGAYPPWKKVRFAGPAKALPATSKLSRKGKRISAFLYMKTEKERDNVGRTSRVILPYIRLRGRNKKPSELNNGWRKKVGQYHVEFTE